MRSTSSLLTGSCSGQIVRTGRRLNPAPLSRIKTCPALNRESLGVTQLHRPVLATSHTRRPLDYFGHDGPCVHYFFSGNHAVPGDIADFHLGLGAVTTTCPRLHPPPTRRGPEKIIPIPMTTPIHQAPISSLVLLPFPQTVVPGLHSQQFLKIPNPPLSKRGNGDWVPLPAVCDWHNPGSAGQRILIHRHRGFVNLTNVFCGNHFRRRTGGKDGAPMEQTMRCSTRQPGLSRGRYGDREILLAISNCGSAHGCQSVIDVRWTWLVEKHHLGSWAKARTPNALFFPSLNSEKGRSSRPRLRPEPWLLRQLSDPFVFPAKASEVCRPSIRTISPTVKEKGTSMAWELSRWSGRSGTRNLVQIFSSRSTFPRATKESVHQFQEGRLA